MELFTYVTVNKEKVLVNLRIFRLLREKGVNPAVALTRAINPKTRGMGVTTITLNTSVRQISACRFCGEAKSYCTKWKPTLAYREFIHFHWCKPAQIWWNAARRLYNKL